GERDCASDRDLHLSACDGLHNRLEVLHAGLGELHLMGTGPGASCPGLSLPLVVIACSAVTPTIGIAAAFSKDRSPGF
ncbi:MAG TPA: hypothetical protein VF070_10755, partial [Streptosporangiaceae bacterium]